MFVRNAYEKASTVIEEWVKQLKVQMAKRLPGEEAHMNMAPDRAKDIKRSFSHNTSPRESAVLILLYKEDGLIKFPLTVRQTYAGVHSGQVSLPGGKYEDNDADLTATALRETHEEIGVSPDLIEIIGRLTTYYVPPSNFNIHPYVGYVSNQPNFTIDTYEVSKLLNINLNDLFDLDLRKEKLIETSNGFKIDAPYFDIQDQVVWGATAMILSEFLEIINRMNK